jgi:RNA polymerase sigma-70 factor (ECF subfamily)
MSHSRNAGRGASDNAPTSTSTSLLNRVKAGEAEAWERLADLYGPLVYGWCRQSGLQAEDAADVGQEVFAAVLAGVTQFRRDRPGDSFRGWLWTITRNKIRDHFRRRSGKAQAQGGTEAQQRLAQVPDGPPDLSVTSPASKVRGLLEHHAVEIVRAGVEERTWRAFWLATVEGRAAADVAQELGMTAQAVYDAKYRVRRRIRQELGDLIE